MSYIRYPVTGATFPSLAPNGTAGAPSYSFINDPTTGLYLPSTGVLGLSAGGVLRGQFDSNGLTLSGGLRFSLDNSYDIGGSISTLRPRNIYASNSLSINNGKQALFTDDGTIWRAGVGVLQLKDSSNGILYFINDSAASGLVLKTDSALMLVYTTSDFTFRQNTNLNWINDGVANIGNSSTGRPNHLYLKGSIQINGSDFIIDPVSGNITRFASGLTAVLNFDPSSDRMYFGFDSDATLYVTPTNLQVFGTKDFIWNTDAGGNLGDATHRPGVGFFKSRLVLGQITTPANPASGSNALYFKADNNLYSLTSAGVETAIGGGSASYPLLAPDGSQSAPSYSFSNYTGHGMFATSDLLSFSVGGINHVNISTSLNALTFPNMDGSSGKLIFGSSTAQPYFRLDGTTTRLGLYIPTGELFTIRVNSSLVANFQSGGLLISSGTSLDASAALQVDSTVKGFLPPRMTTTQKLALVAAAATGLVIYDTTLNKLCVFTGAAFETVTSV